MRKKELRKSIDDFSRALGQGFAAVYRRNFDSDVYEYMGEYIKEITGYSWEELTPDMWDALIISAEMKGEMAGLSVDECNQLVRSGKVDRWRADVQIRTRSGEVRWVNDMSTVLRDKTGECYGSLGVMQDITERKEAEQKLTELTEKLRVRNEEMEADLAMAREVQQALVTEQGKQFPPDATGKRSRLLFYHRYIPTEMLAGDFFDILPLSENEVGVFVSDVVGHGVRAALLTTFLRGSMEELMPEANDPGTFLGKINQSLSSVFGKSNTFVFATAAYLVIDLKNNRVRFANAGHPKPLCLRPEANELFSLSLLGKDPEPALGVVDDFQYSTGEHVLSGRDILLLYTDGLFEALNSRDEMYGEDRLAEFVQQHAQLEPEDLLEGLVGDVRHFSGRAQFEDDVCLLAVAQSHHGGD